MVFLEIYFVCVSFLNILWFLTFILCVSLHLLTVFFQSFFYILFWILLQMYFQYVFYVYFWCFLTIMFWSLITHCFYLLGIYFRFYWQLCFSVSWPFYVFCNLFFIFDVSFRCFLSLILFFNTFCFSLTTKKRKGEIQFICKYCEDND